MTDPRTNTQPPAGDEAVSRQSINPVRRRLSKAALASPVIASMAARPAIACSVSGFMSGNQSPGHGDYQCPGYGCTPGFWKNNPEVWFRTGIFSAGQCGEMNNGGNCQSWTVGGTTLGQILPAGCGNPFIGFASSDFLLAILLKGVTGNDVTQYADICHYVAAILNAASTPAYGTTIEEIKAGLCKAVQQNKVNEYTTVILARLNERGCLYDAHGGCEQGFVLNGGTPPQCIPACPVGQEFDPNTVSCVPKTAP